MVWFSVIAGGAMLWLGASIWALAVLGRGEACEAVESPGHDRSQLPGRPLARPTALRRT